MNGYYLIEPEGRMRVPVKIFANERLLEKMRQDGSFDQAMNVATLPGIVGASIVLPDAHLGYGFSVGGVAAFDAKEGIISPGGIGFDINCGVRLLATNLTRNDIEPKMKELVDDLYDACPVGVGVQCVEVSDEELRDLSRKGAAWAIEQGYGNEDDLEHCESGGCLPEADPRWVSPKAMSRGRKQLGTVGSGNHFVEVQIVDAIFDDKTAGKFGLESGQVVVMIHCGSRGFGHQICTDYIRKIEKRYPEIVEQLPDRNLVYAPIGSDIAVQYWGAMNAAANFAFTNRHILGDNIRKVLKEMFGADTRTVYDVCHNIAKREIHMIDGEEREVIVHRKGATRAFPPGSAQVPQAYRDVGQPVIIPGSMGTASFVLVGQKESMTESFGSTAHGAGRLMSRTQAKKEYPASSVERHLRSRGVTLRSRTKKGISEEAPGAYKDVDDVVEVSDRAGIAGKVARLVPIGVVKG